MFNEFVDPKLIILNGTVVDESSGIFRGKLEQNKFGWAERSLGLSSLTSTWAVSDELTTAPRKKLPRSGCDSHCCTSWLYNPNGGDTAAKR